MRLVDTKTGRPGVFCPVHRGESLCAEANLQLGLFFNCVLQVEYRSALCFALNCQGQREVGSEINNTKVSQKLLWSRYNES